MQEAWLSGAGLLLFYEAKMTFGFQLLKRSGRARRGLLRTPHGEVDTPVFMPVGTQGTVKSLTPEQVWEAGGRMILGNTYHLYLRPGTEVVAQSGGLHRMMTWKGPILTDSGGFQVFSLAALRTLTEEGVEFQSHIDGSRHFLSPEKVIEIQSILGSDVMMVLDECTAPEQPKDYVERSVGLTTRWAARSLEAWRRLRDVDRVPGVPFGIVQGGLFRDLRQRSAEELIALDFPGYAIGGLSVGEKREAFEEILDWTASLLPEDRPRYLMGVGTPRDFLLAVRLGVDMFDCVMPTRAARNAAIYTPRGRVSIRRAEFTRDQRPVDEQCDCYTCRTFSRAYLRHLFISKEILGAVLATIHNIRFFTRFMAAIRESIEEDRFEAFYDRNRALLEGTRDGEGEEVSDV